MEPTTIGDPAETQVDLPVLVEPDSRWVWPPLCAELRAITEPGLSGLVRQLCDLAHRRSCQTVAWTSRQRGAGRSTLLLTLLSCLRDSSEVRPLLIDADLESPALARELRWVPERGWWDLCLDPQRLDETLRACTREGVTVLPLRGPVPRSQLQGHLAEWQRLFAELRSRFDLIWLDTPPLEDGSDPVTWEILHTADAWIEVAPHQPVAGPPPEGASQPRPRLPQLGVVDTFT